MKKNTKKELDFWRYAMGNTIDDLCRIWKDAKDPLYVLARDQKSMQQKTQIYKDAWVGAGIGKQRDDFCREGIKSAKEKADEYRAVWLTAAEKLRKKHPNRNIYSTRRIAKEVSDQLKLDDKRFQSLYKFMLKKGM